MLKISLNPKIFMKEEISMFLEEYLPFMDVTLSLNNTLKNHLVEICL